MKFFKQKSLVLIDKIKKLSNKYPYCSQFFLPVINNFNKKYSKHSFLCDWLCIPYFFWFYKEDEYPEKLQFYEDFLKEIYKILGEKEYEKLVEYFHNEQSNGNTINAIHQKIYEFFNELKGAIHFKDEKPKKNYKKGYADWQMGESEELGHLECKFINNSHMMQSYIFRFIYMAQTLCFRKEMIFIEDFYYSVWGREQEKYVYGLGKGLNVRPLSQENINTLQAFLKKIFFEQIESHSVILKCQIKKKGKAAFREEKIKIEYIKPDLISESFKRECFKETSYQKKTIFEYIKEYKLPEIISQFQRVEEKNFKKYAYISIQFDDMNSFHTFSCDIKQLIELFAKDEIELIIDDVKSYL